MRLIVKNKCKSKNVKIHHPKIAYGKSKMWRWFSSFWGLSYPKQNGELESFRSHFARENDDFIGGFDGIYEHGGIEPMKNKDQTGLQWAMGIELGTWNEWFTPKKHNFCEENYGKYRGA